MDLSFSRFEADASVTILPSDLAVLMVGIAARQAASPTALRHAHLVPAFSHRSWFAPEHGAFNLPVAEMLSREQEGMNSPFTEPL